MKPCLVAAALTAAIVPVSAPAQVLPPGFVSELVQGGFDKPIAFAFLPDGRMIVAEQATHHIKVVAQGAVATIGTIPDVDNGVIEDERGIQHIAVDPQWPARPYLYAWFTHTAPHRCWLVMYPVTGDLTAPASTNLVMGAQYVILNDILDDSENHNGGSIRFGADGMLYLSTGDDYGNCVAQDRGSGLGAILRLDVSSLPGPGTGPPPKTQIAAPGNPFTTPNDMARLCWAYGLRNPFRFSIDPVTSHLLIADVGNFSWEEIDWATAPGQNFGWPWKEANANGPGGCGGAAPPSVAPIAAHTHASGSAAVIALAVYRNPPAGVFNFGAAYEGDFFYTDYVYGFIRRLKFNGTSWAAAPAVPGQPSSSNWGSGFNFVTDGAIGPDGALYYVQRIAGQLRRIRSTATGPVISAFAGNNQAVNAGSSPPAPLVARVTNAAMVPVPNVPVAFAIVSGDGALSSTLSYTDSAGLASTVFTATSAAAPSATVQATTMGSMTTFDVVLRGLVVHYYPPLGALFTTVRHSQTNAPFTLAVDAPPASAYVSTPWGDVWTSVLAPLPTLSVLDGLGLAAPPNPQIATGPVNPIWSMTLVHLPPFGGVTLTLQAYGIDSARYPAADAYFISNAVTLTLN